jgi:hypothetical protein
MLIYHFLVYSLKFEIHFISELADKYKGNITIYILLKFEIHYFQQAETSIKLNGQIKI